MALENVDLGAATASSQTPNPTCGGYSSSSKDMWYRVVVPAGINSLAFHAFNSNVTPMFSSSQPELAVYRGSNCTSLTLLGCFESTGGFMENKEIRWEQVSGLNPGETLYIRIWDKSNLSQKLFLAVSVRLDMEEDNCNTPMELSTGGCNILSTGGDISAPDNCGWNSTDNSIFFNFTVNADDPQPYTITVEEGECWANSGTESPEIQFAVYQWNGSNCSGIGGSGSTYMGCANGTGTVVYSHNLAPGNYVLAMDGYSMLSGNSLCLFGFEAPFINPQDIIVNLNTTDQSCGELGTASITVTQSCTGNPLIQWSTSGTGTSISNLTAGSYSVTITDGPDCDTVVENFVIGTNNNFSVDAYTTGDACDEVISATAEVTGATPGQCTFSWNTVPAQYSQTAQLTSGGTYTVTATYGTCTDTDDVTVSFYNHIVVSNFSDNHCINSNTEYEVSFNVNYTGGGAANFNVNTGTGNVSSNGNFLATYPSGTGYTITVTDVNGCDIFTYNGMTDCGCSTFAGTMSSLEPITLCANECTDMITHNGDQYLEADDLMEFIVHAGGYPAIPLARSSTPEFCFSNLNGGDYGVTYYVSAIAGNDLGGHVNPSDPCYSQSQGTPVIWYENPVAFISATELTTCSLSVTLNAIAPQPGMSGVWSSPDPFFAINGTSIYSNVVNVLVTSYNDQVFTWTVSNGICSGTDEVVVHFLSTPSAYAGEDFAICGNIANLEAVQSVTGSTGQWSGNGSFTSLYNFQTQVTGASYGQITYTWRENVGICWDEDQVIVNFIPEPNPNVTEIYDTVCGTTGNLSVINVIGNGSWAAWYDGSLLSPAPIYNPGLSYANTEVTIGNYPISETSRTVEFVWTETTQGGGLVCTSDVSRFITFSRKPVASVGATNEAEICGNSLQLAADITGSEWATGMWISPMFGSIFDDNTLPNAIATIPVLGSFGDSAYVRTPLIWAMNNTGCTSMDTMFVTFYRRPSANAGLDNTVCGNYYPLGAVYSLSQTGNYNPSGSWSVFSFPSGGQANITPSNQDSVNVTVSHHGIWQFVFRENNSNLTSCYSTDTVQIEFVEKPVIFAGEDKDVCGQSTQLEGVSGGFSGSWLPNGVYIAEFSDPHSSVTSNTYSTISFVWLESNQFCTSMDTVNITFWRQPHAEILTDEADSTVCGLTFYNLRAENPGTGISGIWYSINPAIVYGDPFSNFTWATVPNYGYHNFYWIESTGPEMQPGFCTDTAGPLRIHFIEVPNANAGGDTLFCGNSGYLNAIPSGGTGVWSTPSNELVVIENQNDPGSYIESAVINTGNPTYPYFTLIWTEDNSNGCTDSDTMRVVFARIPSSNMQIIAPKCFGEPATIAAAEDSLQQYTWNFYGGIIDSVAPDNDMGGTYENFVYWTDGEESHIVSLIATNFWECQSAINMDTIVEPAIPEFGVRIISDTCALGKGGIIFEDTILSNAFFWLHPEYGPPIGTPITTVYNLPAGDYDIRVSYLTPNITNYAYYLQTFGTANCIDTVQYEIEPIGIIEAEISISADIILEDLVAPEANVIFINSSFYDNVGKRCEWHFGDGTIQKTCDELVEHVYTKAGCYDPFLIVMNRDLLECRDTAYLETCVFIDDMSKLEIPNIFSPNADGINDFFQVKAQTLRTFSGIIVNRWGRTVYEWENWRDYEAGWDGTLDGGTKASPGVYYYIIKAEGIDGTPYDSQGVLHLMRE